MTSPRDVTSRNSAGPGGPIVHALVSQAKAQPAKTAATAAMVVVLAILVVRMFVKKSSAAANTGVSAALVVPPLAPYAAAQIADEASAADGLAVPLDGSTAGQTIASPESAQSLRSVIEALQTPVVVPRVLTRDIFSVDLRRYPHATDKALDGSATEADPTRLPAQSQWETIKIRASKLRLQGTVTGPTNAAFLDGNCVYQGQLYRAFRVVTISEQSVVLESEGVRLELRMPEH